MMAGLLELAREPGLGMLIAFLLLAIVSSGLFSGLETGIYALNRLRLELRQERGNDKRAQLLGRLTRRPVLLLCVFLLANNAANAAAAMLGEVWAERYFADERSSFVTAAVLTPILFLCGEALPKHMFLLHAETWTYRLGPALYVARILFAPLIMAVLPFARMASRWARERERISAIRAESNPLEGLLVAGSEEISSSLRETALGVSNQQTMPVAKLMRPLERTRCLDASAGREELRAALERSRHRRFPLRDQDGGYTRYVYFLDPFLESQRNPEEPSTLADFGRPLVELRDDCPLDEALAMLETEKGKVGVVRDRDGSALGFVMAGELLSMEGG
ncbi:MAG: CNNM domain-containing protein [Planctomycetota bacterium]